MPPPPPPSASYLLDIDTDDSECEGDQVQPSPPAQVAAVSAGTKLQEEDDSNNTNTPASPTKKKKKKRKRRRKKKTTQARNVHFGNVSVREYERCLGETVVPVDGGWPLGMSPTIVNEYQVASTVDEFEERRQKELRKRWLEIMASHVENDDASCSSSNNNNKNAAAITSTLPPLLIPPKGELETRQYDYRKRPNDITKSRKNPLFGPLNEDSRMRLLISNDDTADDKDDASSVQSTSSDVTRSPSRSPSIKQRRRNRSNSMHSNDGSNNKRHSTRRTRSNSEQFYTQHYPSTDVLHIRNELEQIRVHRTLEGSVGCTCRKLDVYLPPPDGGGKKAQHRRLKPQKVKEELRKRNKLPANSQDYTRAELEQLLHDVVESEPCCWGDDCSCRSDGIGCQADACTCWFDSHQKKGGHHDNKEETSVQEIRERCGNNMYAVDLDGIHQFRLQFCQEVNGGVDADTAKEQTS